MKRCPQCGKTYSSEANFCPVDAQRLEDVTEDAPSASDDHVLGGRFVVGDQIGGGQTGQVFKATDKNSGHQCVVKWVDDEVFSSPLQLQRTERELKQLERQGASGIAKVLAHGRKSDRLWIASEYVAGTALDQLIGSVGPLPVDRATRIVHDVGVALAEAAKLGVIHRDVAPKNVLVGTGDEVHVINFGIAVPATPSVRGVPEYVAPEQVDGKPVDQRSNIYSLGAMLFSALTGRPPFEGDAESVHNAHLHSNPPSASSLIGGAESGASELGPDVAEGVDKLLARALAKQSSKRFMTLRQLLAELEKLGGIEPASTQRMSRPSTRAPSVGSISGSNANAASSVETTSMETTGKEVDPNNQTLLGVAAFERNQQGAVVEVKPVIEQPTASDVAPPADSATEQPDQAVVASGESLPSATLRNMPAPATGAPPSASAPTGASTNGAGSMEPVTPVSALATTKPGQGRGSTPIPEVVAVSPALEPATPLTATPEVASVTPAAPASMTPKAAAAPVVASVLAPPVQPQAEATAGANLGSSLGNSAKQHQEAGEPQPSASIASGKKKRRKRKTKKKDPKNKFRETMWFKKGELDEAAAEAASMAPDGEIVSTKADTLPEDERYKDDGSITSEDQDRLSLRTGHTQMMSAIDESKLQGNKGGGGTAVSDKEIAREMTGGNRNLLIAAAIVAVAVFAVVIFMIAK